MKLERLLEYSESLAACGTQDEIKAVCKTFAHSLGFEHFIYGAYFPLAENIVILNGFPDPWRAHYDSAGYMYSDPTVKHCSVKTSAIEWSQLDLAKDQRGTAEREIMSEAAVYGLRQGVSVPVHGPGGEWGMMSLSSKERYSPTMIHDTRFHTQFIAQAAHEALKRVVNAVDGDSLESQLTVRECECLQWTANGKTAWEISKILCLSESTVAFHLKNAINKMAVANRPQAVAKAVAQSRITLF
ncbi:MAG: LuxR family transcriptional regulator [Granulosicoccaceae bacterium]